MAYAQLSIQPHRGLEHAPGKKFIALLGKTAVMEEDRDATNLAPETSPDLTGDAAASSKQPKRRFIGRKAANERAAARGVAHGAIEESSAIQGAATIHSHTMLRFLLTLPQSHNLEGRHAP